MKKFLFFTAILIILPFAANAQCLQEQRVASFQRAGLYADTFAIRDITYKVADGDALQLDIAYPKGNIPDGGYPLIVYYHGGAWSGGNRFEGYGFFPDEIRHYTSKGIAVATVTYRFVSHERTIVDCVIDCKDAIRFIVKNADSLEINPSKIGVYGHSAGGHLSMMVALAENDKFIGAPALKDVNFKIACAVPLSGPTSFINPEADFLDKPHLIYTYTGKHFMGLSSKEETFKIAKLLSPSEYVRKDSPPMLVIIGEKDTIVPANSATFIGEKAKECGAPFEIFIAPNAEHSFEGGNHLEILNKRRAFFEKHLLQ